MHPNMSQKTRQEALARKCDRYARAGKEHKTKILNELVELFDYHRKAAIRALQPRSAIPAPFVLGRPKDYDPDSRVVRKYGPAVAPLSRVLACAQVPAQTKARLEAEKKTLNPFALRREVDRQLKEIEAHRRAPEA
jgi:hypothetical protein